MFLILGFGNPGSRYELTRHNAGFLALDNLADKYKIKLAQHKYRSLYGKGEIEGLPVILIKPMTYMNLSGESVGKAMRFFRIPLERVLVVHDELDLEHVARDRLHMRAQVQLGKLVDELVDHVVMGRVRVLGSSADFDDALSFQALPNGNYEIGIHIADVSHYVQPGSILDEEAYNRATSVYLVDRVVPMLPEKLSNGVCSLRPNEEKFTFSAVFEIDSNGKIKQEWFGRTVIHSDRRFTYEEAQEIIETGEGELHEEIGIMDRIAKKLRKKRFRAGAVSFDRVEVKFELNQEDNATPIGVYFKEAKDSNKLIEEYMLLANRKVAQYIGDKQKNKNPKTFVYRIHDKPKPDKFDQFANFIVQFGLNVERGENANISKSLNEVLDAVKGKKEGNMIQTLAVRTMAKAEYSTNNIGHYGLAFDYYSHFTSPIRRYPDVMVHRLLQHYLDGGKTADENEYEEKCIHSSKMEKQASDAERDSIKYKQVEFMSKHLGERFKAIISGVTDWAIYAEIQENLCEGMISIRNLTDDTYVLDADNYCIIGQTTGNKYQMGDEILVEIKNADLSKKQLDFTLVYSLEKPEPEYGNEWDFEV